MQKCTFNANYKSPQIPICPDFAMVYRHLAVAAATAAAVWAYLRNRSTKVGLTPNFRESIAAAVAQCPLKDVPFNVLYTAALYAMWPDVSLDTWTHCSRDDKVTVFEWMLIKRKERVVNKAMTYFCASERARTRYARHRALARHIAESASLK